MIDDDGTMARLPRLLQIAQRHDLPIITIEDLIKYRRMKEKLVMREAETPLPTRCGEFRLILYGSTINDEHHVALVMGDVAGKQNVLVRVHSSCFTGDVLGACAATAARSSSRRCAR